MLNLEEVMYTRISIACDWPGCTNRINSSPSMPNRCRERADMSSICDLAVRWGWMIDDGPHSEAICPYHNQKEKK